MKSPLRDDQQTDGQIATNAVERLGNFSAAGIGKEGGRPFFHAVDTAPLPVPCPLASTQTPPAGGVLASPPTPSRRWSLGLTPNPRPAGGVPQAAHALDRARTLLRVVRHRHRELAAQPRWYGLLWGGVRWGEVGWGGEGQLR